MGSNALQILPDPIKLRLNRKFTTILQAPSQPYKPKIHFQIKMVSLDCNVNREIAFDISLHKNWHETTVCDWNQHTESAQFTATSHLRLSSYFWELFYYISAYHFDGSYFHISNWRENWTKNETKLNHWERKCIPIEGGCVLETTSIIPYHRYRHEIYTALCACRIEQWQMRNGVIRCYCVVLCGGYFCIAALRRWNDRWIDETRQDSHLQWKIVWKNRTYLFVLRSSNIIMCP